MATKKKSKDPLAIDDNDDDEIVERAAKKTRERAHEIQREREEEPEEESDDDSESFEVGGGQEDDDDAEERDEEPRLSRKDKKRKRLDDIVSERVERALAARDQQRPPPPPPPVQQQGGKTEAELCEEELDGVYSDQGNLWNQYQAIKNPTPEQLKDYEKKARGLKIKEATLLNRRVEIERAPQEAVRQVQQQISARYPDVVADQRAFAYAQGRWQQLIAEGKPQSWETADKAMDAARERFGIKRPGQRQDTEARRQRYTGTRGGASGNSSRTEATTVKMSPLYKKMARTAYPHLYKKDPKLAYQKWVDGPGKRLSAKGQLADQ